MACIRKVPRDRGGGQGSDVSRMVREVRAQSAFLAEDRALEQELRHVVEAIRERQWGLYE